MNNKLSAMLTIAGFTVVLNNSATAQNMLSGMSTDQHMSLERNIINKSGLSELQPIEVVPNSSQLADVKWFDSSCSNNGSCGQESCRKKA